MPTAPFKRLTRRMIWSTSASITLLFLTSTSSLPSVAVPPTGFSLGLDKLFAAPCRPRSRRARAIPRAQAAASAPFHLTPAGDRPHPTSDGYLERLPFSREIRGAAKRYGVDSLLLASIIEAESSFRPDAVSTKGALGLMQLMPLHFVATGPSIEPVDPLDPTVNLNLGARYLRDLRKRYDGDLELALAAYHAGPGTIDRFGGLPPYRETQVYVSRVLKLYSAHQREAGIQAPGGALSASPASDLPLRRAEIELGS